MFFLVVAVKESVVNCPAILQTNNPQSSILKFGNPRPPSNPTIGLSFLMFWMGDDVLNPLVFDHGSVVTQACVLKISSLEKS